MADFLFLFRVSEETKTSADQQELQMEKWSAWIGELSRAGKFRAGEPLEPQGKLIRGKDRVVTDGPLTETKGSVGGYLLVSAEDLDDAVRIAKGCPAYELNGSVEVRPLMI
jgi:hypothetical protein